MHRVIFIGDVHGCIDELEAMWALVAPAPGDEVVLVGDLVAKGPDSQAVVQLARERGVRAVRGNHDAKVLKWRRDPATELKPDHARVAASLGEADWRYLEERPLWLDFPAIGARCVHGGFVPGLPPGEHDPDVLMNLRSLTPAGAPSKRVDEGTPWAKHWTGPEHVLFGHDALRGLQQEPFATGLDTGCVYGNRLTASVWPERRLVHVPAKRVYAELRK